MLHLGRVCQTRCILNAELCLGHRALTRLHAPVVESPFHLWVFVHVFYEPQQCQVVAALIGLVLGFGLPVIRLRNVFLAPVPDLAQWRRVFY